MFLSRVVLLGLFTAALGCAPTYAPPIRTVHGGAPGRLDQGDMEVAAASSGVVIPAGMGGGMVGYAARPHLTVEGGVDATDGWTLGWGGVRVPHRWRSSHPWLSLAVDGGGGLGVGVGGKNCHAEPTEDFCDSDQLRWYERPAGGGYLGAGAALRLGPVSLYTRTRLQMAWAKNTPATQWASAMLGLHVHILDRADLWGGVAMAHYSNDDDSARGLVSEVGLAFRFDPHYGWRLRQR